MTNTNDNKIKILLDAIEAKTKSLGPKPKAVWETNGVINGRNINTIDSIEACVELAATLMASKGSYEKACEFLGVKSSNTIKNIDDSLADVKLRAQIITWKEKKNELQVLEKKLKDLRSEDAKTEDALADISLLLNV